MSAAIKPQKIMKKLEEELIDKSYKIDQALKYIRKHASSNSPEHFDHDTERQTQSLCDNGTAGKNSGGIRRLVAAYTLSKGP